MLEISVCKNDKFFFQQPRCEIMYYFLMNLHMSMQLHGVDDNIGKSKKVLTAMSRRMDKNKWIIGGIIFSLVLAILLILYFKLAY